MRSWINRCKSLDSTPALLGPVRSGTRPVAPPQAPPGASPRRVSSAPPTALRGGQRFLQAWCPPRVPRVPRVPGRRGRGQRAAAGRGTREHPTAPAQPGQRATSSLRLPIPPRPRPPSPDVAQDTWEQHVSPTARGSPKCQERRSRRVCTLKRGRLGYRRCWLPRIGRSRCLCTQFLFIFILEPVETRIKSPSEKTHALFTLSQFQQIETRQGCGPTGGQPQKWQS